MWRTLLLVGIAGFVGACTEKREGPPDTIGEMVHVVSDVYFVTHDGKPAEIEPIHIAEQIGIETTTLVTATDTEGRITLRGYYCTPLTVAASGGSVAIRRDNLKRTYTVTLSEDRKPALGPPWNDPTAIRGSRAHDTCGLEG